MKEGFYKFRVFIEKHIWADFLFIFLTYGALSYFFSGSLYKDDSFGFFILNIAVFALIMTPVMRYSRNITKPHPMELGDHASYFTKGQRPQLKAYLESKGYTVNRNEGATTYFNPDSSSKSHISVTFIYETDHWMALIASDEIRLEVPKSITPLYPLI